MEAKSTMKLLLLREAECVALRQRGTAHNPQIKEIKLFSHSFLLLALLGHKRRKRKEWSCRRRKSWGRRATLGRSIRFIGSLLASSQTTNQSSCPAKRDYDLKWYCNCSLIWLLVKCYKIVNLYKPVIAKTVNKCRYFHCPFFFIG